MKRLLGTLVVGAILVVAAAAVAQTAPATPAASPAASGATFEMAYRGLALPDDPLGYRSFWGFGGATDIDKPFVAAVKKRVQKCDIILNGALPEALQWSVVELQDGNPVAFYFDTDGNGELADNEKFPLAPPAQRQNFPYPYAFVTSDFMTRTQDGKEAPFRIRLVGQKYANSPISYMWSPSCILEGQATLNGEPTKMILYANGYDAGFSTFRRASYALYPVDQKIERYAPSDSLSSLIYYKGTFYRIKTTGAHTKDATLRVTLEKDTTPTGNFGYELKGKEPLKSRLTSRRISGTTDDTVYLGLGNDSNTLPIGGYKLSSAYVSYGTAGNAEWQVNFSDSQTFIVTAGQTCTVQLGEPNLSLTAVAEKERYNSSVKPRTTFAKGTAIYIAPQIKGKAGEAFTRFQKKTLPGSKGLLARLLGRGTSMSEYTDVKPHLTIADADGKRIVSTDLEYG